MRKNSFGARLIRVLALAFLCLAGAAYAARSQWTIVDLGGDSWSVTANAVNNRGEVAGWMYVFPGGVPFHHGFVWSNGAFTDLGSRRLGIHRTRVLDERGAAAPARLRVAETHAIIECADGGCLRVLEAALDGHASDARGLLQHFGPGPHPLT